jgi:hypothetical protein
MSVIDISKLDGIRGFSHNARKWPSGSEAVTKCHLCLRFRILRRKIVDLGSGGKTEAVNIVFLRLSFGATSCDCGEADLFQR